MWLKRGILPLAFLALGFLSSCQSPEKVPSPKNLESHLEKSGRNYNRDKYALLICGKNEKRFEYDLSAIYQVLLRRGFKDKDIIILDEHGEEEFLYHSNGQATEENVKKAFENLSGKVDSLDTLVVHIDNHGSYSAGYTRFGAYSLHSISLADGTLTKTELGEYLSKIRPRAGIVTIDTCYAEGMLGSVPEEYVRIAGARESSVGLSKERDSFGGRFYLAWCDKDIKTIKDAFERARTRHTYTVNGRVDPVIKFKKGMEYLPIP